MTTIAPALPRLAALYNQTTPAFSSGAPPVRGDSVTLSPGATALLDDDAAPSMVAFDTDRPGQPYASADDAAMGAFRQYGQRSRDEHTEYGGIIYKCQKDGQTCYSYTRATTPQAGDNVGPRLWGLVGLPNDKRFDRETLDRAFASAYPGAQPVGWYHTHPYFKDCTNERFSGEDNDITRTLKLPAYLMTASGHVLMNDPDPHPMPADGRFHSVEIGTIPLQGEVQVDQTRRVHE